ncbi:MAG: hypothetical protein WBM11_10235 [Terriglobales bacterium]
MATPTLANSHIHPLFREILRSIAPPNTPNDGKVLDDLTQLVEKVEQPKPPQPDGFTIPDSIPTDDQRRARNAEMLNALWILGECMAAQSLAEIPARKQLDPLTIALNGFPDVNTYYADREGR